MRSFSRRTAVLIAAAAGTAQACTNPETDACASAFNANLEAASSFCPSFTAAENSADAAPTGFASACNNNVKSLSKECSCYVTGGAAAAATSSAAPAPVTASATGAVGGAQPTGAFGGGYSASSSSALAAAPVPTTLATKTNAAVPSQSASVSVAAAATASVSINLSNACTVTAYDGVSSAVDSCSTILLSGVSMPASSTLDLQSLQTSATVIFAGTTSFGYTEDEDFDPIVVSGTDITITGESGHVIDGNGQAYWDGEGSNGGSDKPDHFFVVKDVYNGVISNLNIQNWPTHCFEVEDCYGLSMTGITLDNSAGDAANSKSDGDPAAHNSDGFDISKSDSVTVDSCTVYNQDDCVAVTSGSNIVINNMYCSGGHGLSIGSIGGKSNNTVSGVTFSNSQVVDSENGVRIKSNSDTTGTVENVTYKNITMSGITDYGLDVQQDYLNGGPTGDPTNGVTISGITFDSVTGTVTGDDSYAYYILCGSGSCSDFTFTDVSITGGGETSSCNYPDSGCPS